MVVELGGVERSGDEELFRFATGGITVVANIFVEKLAALIVPHVDDDASVVSENDLRILMFETAERRTRFGRRTRIEEDRFPRYSRAYSARWDVSRYRSVRRLPPT